MARTTSTAGSGAVPPITPVRGWQPGRRRDEAVVLTDLIEEHCVPVDGVDTGNGARLIERADVKSG
jgi:hypothetical protein